jgi:signal transduction histidine kinase
MSYPLGVIASICANLSDELKGGVADRDELVQAIGLIERNALHCARIVEALGHYARAARTDSGGLAVAITSPEAIVGDALMMVEQQFREVGRVTIQTEFPEKPLTIVGEHHLITQALVNLLLNARDAMQPAGGVIRLRFWTPDPAREPALATRLRPATLLARRADLVAFAVTDSGTGIHPSMVDDLFEPFSTTKPDGAGLGLPIARDIVARHGGLIWGENNPTGGATFTVVLPRKQ